MAAAAAAGRWTAPGREALPGRELASSRSVGIARDPVGPLVRSKHATALLDGDLVLCIGGEGPGGVLASCQVYDPATDEWYEASPLRLPRSWASATPMADGRILVLGGYNGTAGLSLASIFDPSDDSWSAGTPLAAPRYNHAATPLPDGRIVLTGGVSHGPLAGAEVYVPDA